MAQSDTHEEENYFISMTDMLVGLLFIFIILMMYFILLARKEVEQAAERAREAAQVSKKFTDIENVRSRILDEMAGLLHKDGIRVTVIHEHGILRMPESLFFDKGVAKISERGKGAMQILAKSLLRVLPCYTVATIALAKSVNCDDGPRTASIDAIFIEGHTDNDPIKRPYGGMEDNIDLSVKRAANSYRELIEISNGSILEYKNADKLPVLSVSGYGEYRKIVENDNESNMTKNRRIDLRILMEAPEAEEVERIIRDLQDR